jgi:hypothetical protein
MTQPLYQDLMLARNRYSNGEIDLDRLIAEIENIKLQVNVELLWDRLNFALRDLRTISAGDGDAKVHAERIIYSLSRQWDIQLPLM